MSGDPRMARTRRRVLDAAWELLTEVGFDGVTVELVSERSGVARSTLYRHWTTKSELLRDAFTEVAEAAHPDGPSAARPAERLAAYAVTFADGLSLMWGRAALTLSISALDDPDQRAVQQVFIEGNRRDLASIVRAGVDAGELPATADLDALVGELEELVVAPLFYRYIFTEAPATAQDARRIAARAWTSLRRHE